MTHDDNIERVLERWFTEGPRHMSDRLFDGTLDRIERLPRGRLADLQSRLPAMTLNTRLLAAAAVIVALVGAGLVVLNGVPGVGAPSSPTPLATGSQPPVATASPRAATRYVAPGFRPFGLGTTGTFSAAVPLHGSAQQETTDITINNPFGRPDASTPSYIYIVSGIRPGTEPASASCAAPFSAPQRTPVALAAWIRTFPSLEVSSPRPVTIGGLDGVLVDLTERPDAPKTCGQPRTVGSRIEVLGGGSWVDPTIKLRLILLDRGDGESILIDIATREPTWDAVDAAMAIVNAFGFTR